MGGDGCITYRGANVGWKGPCQTEDPRRTGLKNGLRQLSVEQLCRVIAYDGDMVLDTYNYHDGKFCPLAIACRLDVDIKNPTDESVRAELESMGYRVNNTRGLKGEFYTSDRRADLLTAAKEVLREKLND